MDSRDSAFFITQTPCILRGKDGFGNECTLTVKAEASCETTLRLDEKTVWSGTLHAGENTVSFCIPEPAEERQVVFSLEGFGSIPFSVSVPRHWQVHVVQLSHHDPGYTDIPSHVIAESARFLKQALDDMDSRDDYSEDCRYRIVVEQAYSLWEFLKTASDKDRARMMARIRRGDVEVTALWANLVSELLSPEEMLRALYPAKKIARESGVSIISAEHNDIPGFSWGYCTALCQAGIRFFAPGLPEYYNWGDHGLSSYWDNETIIGRNTQGGFWWESAEGDRLLFWHNRSGCGGNADPKMPELLPLLNELTAADHPHKVCRLVVQGASRDNSPYTPAFADAIRAWNEKYAFPHLVCSTEAMFYRAFTEQLDVELPVWRGGVDGQDYPIATTSQMSASALNRENHTLFRSAEMLCTLTQDDPVMTERKEKLQTALTDMLMADEHAFGFTYPACPGHRASFWEHGVYAVRANADFYDVLMKSMASVADRVKGDPDGFRLTVFNTSGVGGRHSVIANLRDLDNCGTQIVPGNKDGVPRLYELGNRMQVTPQSGYLQGKFRLRDRESGDFVPFVLRRIAWDDPSDLAAARAGIGAGTPRMGFFEDPQGTALQAEFVADLPACGYKTFDLVPCEDEQSLPAEEAAGSVENEYYRILFDRTGITDILSLDGGESLFDESAPHKPLTILVRNANEDALNTVTVRDVRAERNELGASVTVSGFCDGIYDFSMRMSLSRGVDAVSLALRVVKNEKPLQTVYLCFPFRGTGVRYQGTFFDGKPVENLLPGSHSDAIACQDWVLTEGSDILWNSANAPVVSLSHLWDGYISPAHRCISDYRIRKPLKAEDYDTGRIYSVLTCNNFGTNFYPTQLSSAVFRYTFAKRHGREPSAWGVDAQNEPMTILTDRSRGSLPDSAAFLSAGDLRILACKEAENGDGVILRLRNDSSETVTAPIRIWGRDIQKLTVCDALERELYMILGNCVTVRPGKMMTLLISKSL